MRHSSTPIWANPDAWKNAMLVKAERGDFDRARQRNAQHSSLLKLAHESLRVHVASVAGGVCPRADDGGSQPLAVALAALKAAATNK
jgi:hypothetical protein